MYYLSHDCLCSILPFALLLQGHLSYTPPPLPLRASLAPYGWFSKVPANFEPGHAALTAATAASSAQSAAADAKESDAHPSDAEKLKLGGKVTTPCTPAEGGWSINGEGERAGRGDGSGSAGGKGRNDERSAGRVASGEGASTQVSPCFCG